MIRRATITSSTFIEFRMSNHDLQARPIHRDSIKAHLTIVYAALAVTH